ncbi:MAG: Crp/Fnr family transcriptional regulator [Ectothiorhodospiraceae bacterium]|nr:Crp/Fnr family transcriptional regulator [Ectothiorhodospiraceae bacterium]MCH8503709.1 Crp/Fnr family transcriptional regulator [Ectothiorhodospiraceae bacterium]
MIMIMHPDTELDSLFCRCARAPGVPHTLEPGETLFRTGDRVVALHVVANGSLRLLRTDREGHEIVLHRAAPGQCIAEPSLFASRYHCDARAETPTTVRAYSRKAILDGMRNNPELALALAENLAGLVQAGRTRASILSLKTAKERLLTHLRLCCDSESGLVELQTTWKTLASELGLTHEAVYRTLAQLEQHGTIRREGARIWLKTR